MSWSFQYTRVVALDTVVSRQYRNPLLTQVVVSKVRQSPNVIIKTIRSSPSTGGGRFDHVALRSIPLRPISVILRATSGEPVIAARLNLSLSHHVLHTLIRPPEHDQREPGHSAVQNIGQAREDRSRDPCPRARPSLHRPFSRLQPAGLLLPMPLEPVMQDELQGDMKDDLKDRVGAGESDRAERGQKVPTGVTRV